MKKRVLAWLLALCMIIGMLPMSVLAEGEEETEGTILRSWILTAGVSENNKLCGYDLDEEVILYVMNDDMDFEEVDFEADLLPATFVAVYDADNDGDIDEIAAVPFDYASYVWDEEMTWTDGAGEADPGIDDETGYEVYGGEQVIPYGERLFEGIGIGEWSGTVDFENAEDSVYWTDNDYYNMESTDTLTILTNYKTTMQPTSWTCGLSSALSVLEWYGTREGLNAYDLANLRGTEEWECGTTIENMTNVFTNLHELGLIGEWTLFSSEDEPYMLFDSEWVQETLASGTPIMVMWNSFGWHWQTIIGYDNMGTENTNDDVLIMMDPYDTTDHNANGYELESYERLIYGTCGSGEEATMTQFFVACPAEETEEAAEEAEETESEEETETEETEENASEETEVEETEVEETETEEASVEETEIEEEIVEVSEEEAVTEEAAEESEEESEEVATEEAEESETEETEEAEAAADARFTDDNKIPYGNTADDIDTYYPDTEYRGENGLAGAATGGYERSGDHVDSPYWVSLDVYNMVDTDTLHILENFSTIQQSTEWTCGLASSLMVMNYFDMAEGETDVHLASIRQDGEAGATYLEGMKEVFTYMNETYDQDWVWVSTEDLDDPDGEESYIGDYCLQAGTLEEWYGLIPYLLDNGIPVMVGSDEWGGHWQVIIGYDDMGTVERTEDDVIILADSYDTTDHNQDGYVIDGFERLVYGWYSSFESEYIHNDFIVAFPASMYEEVVEALGADAE